jgi:hypothetical protein
MSIQDELAKKYTGIIPDCPNFTYEELIYSSTAAARGIDNRPTSEEIYQNLTYVAQKCLQPARDALKAPLRINSGYRSPALNKIVGGSPTSFHSWGNAVDVDNSGRNPIPILSIFQYFYVAGTYTELIAEELPNGWIHIALAKGREFEHQLKYKLSGKSVQRGSYSQILDLFG